MTDQAGSEFDAYAADYQQVLQQGLKLTGEDSSYFAEGRIRHTAQCLRKLSVEVRSVLDFGCGTGTAAEHLLAHFPAARVCGIDVSAASIEQARQIHQDERVCFFTPSALPADIRFDLAYCNGVFHHIPPVQRADALRQIYDLLNPGGVFALWENNPWNPGTRIVMSRVEFDRDAIMLWPGATRRLLRECGFRLLRNDYLFYLPSFLKFLRPLERYLIRIPMGGQYLILCQKA